MCSVPRELCSALEDILTHERNHEYNDYFTNIGEWDVCRRGGVVSTVGKDSEKYHEYSERCSVQWRSIIRAVENV